MSFHSPRLAVYGCVFIGILAGAATSLYSADAENYLQPGSPDGLELLPPPPTPGSPEQTADMNCVRSVFNGRSAQDITDAETEGDFDVFIFQPVLGSFFTEAKLPKTKAFFDRVNDDIETLVTGLKDYYKRPRPCDIDPSLLTGPKARSFGYPSRHATTATVDAILLSEIFPEKTDALLTVGRRLAWHRVILGRHYPTDIFAGRVLGRAVFREMAKDPAFLRDFAEVSTELENARAR